MNLLSLRRMDTCSVLGFVCRTLYLVRWVEAGYFHGPLGALLQLDWPAWSPYSLLHLLGIGQAHLRSQGKGGSGILVVEKLVCTVDAKIS